ncbi:MAG TPA: hypothetical protein VMV44_08680 [Rectinemataceae bacterium]|nr:hypothetical protein [Rectinemataceae bacterium]
MAGDLLGRCDVASHIGSPTALSLPVARLCARAGGRIAALTGLPMLSSESADFWTQMRSFPLPGGDPAAFQRALWEDYAIEVPMLAWKGRRLLRLSIQAYKAPEDVDRLLLALEALL